LLTVTFAVPAQARDADTWWSSRKLNRWTGPDAQLHPDYHECLLQLHDTLFIPRRDATVKPALAEKWEKVDDLTWKITLRKDATS